MPTLQRPSQRGQAIALFAIALAALVLGAAVVVDGGYAFAQRRASQNAADFAALAGTRIVGIHLTGRPPGAGTAANVRAAIDATLAANGAQVVDAQFVDEAGEPMGSVADASHIPHGAFGVIVSARTAWRPFLLGIIGITDWSAASSATAYTPGRSVGGGVMPLGIEDSVFDGHARCQVTDLDDCIDHLTTGHLNIPGGFGWLKFGIQGQGGKCDWTSSLGMEQGGCESSKTLPRLADRAADRLPRLLHRRRASRQRGQDRQPDGQRVGRPELLHRQPDPRLGARLGSRWRHRLECLVPHRRLRGHRPHRRQRARQVARGRDHRVRLQRVPGNYKVAGHQYVPPRTAPFTIDVTGAVQLVR